MKQQQQQQQDDDSQRHVTFHDTVLVWRHDVILGDNPACSIGPPVTLDWNRPAQDGTMTHKPVYLHLSDMVQAQDQRYAAAMVQRQRLRAKHEATPQGPPVRKLNYYQRLELVQASGDYSDAQIHKVERQVRMQQWQRQTSLKMALPTRSVQEVQRVYRKVVKGQGTTRHKRRVIRGWYDHYRTASNKVMNATPKQ